MIPDLPDNVIRLAPEATFRFGCHPGVACFTECCRELELALTPYDILRLKKRLGVDSSTFLERYVIIEKDPRNPFPGLYLTMVDDGRASCVFVGERGCRVYEDRPGACRAYPLGRGVHRTPGGKIRESHVLLRESHCRGFDAGENHTAASYSADQGLDRYNRFNDRLTAILQHEKIRRGFLPEKKSADHFVLFLYDLDSFRSFLTESGYSPDPAHGMDETLALAGDDERLLELGMRLLAVELFGPRK